MNNNIRDYLPKASSAIALLALLFLPIVGCAGEDYNGIQFLTADENAEEMIVAKLLFSVSLIAALAGIFIHQAKHYIATAILGISGMTIAFFILRDQVGVEVRASGILALIAFVIMAVVSLMNLQEHPESNDSS